MWRHLCCATNAVAHAERNTYRILVQAGNVHGKETALAMRGVAPSPGRAGIVVSLSTKKDVRVYSVQVGAEVFTVGIHTILAV